jgi:hypothetical protein
MEGEIWELSDRFTTGGINPILKTGFQKNLF